jgi:hypothetical protein
VSDLSPEQFAVSVLQGIGVKPTKANVQAMVGWTRAEGGHWHNDAKYNPLNTTQPMSGAGNTGSQGNIKVYKNWQQGVEATVKTLKNGHYGGIIQALKGTDPSKVAQAIGSSPWGTNASLAARTIAGAKGAKVAQLAGAAGGTGTEQPAGITVTPSTSTTTQFDQAGYQQAQRQALLARLLQSQGQTQYNNPLLKLGILNPDEPDPAKWMTQSTQTTPTIASSVVRTGGSTANKGQGTFDVEHNGTLKTTFGGVTESIPVGQLPKLLHAGDVTKLKGVVDFEGTPVAAWVGHVLAYARAHGWKGKLTEGYRTDKQQTGIYNSGVRPAAKPKSLGGGGSNHSIDTFPGGAADVSDAAGLNSVLARSPYRNTLLWAGGKDPPHFSHPHNGSY